MEVKTLKSLVMVTYTTTELCAATPVLNLVGDSPSTSSSEGQRSRSNKGSSNDDEPKGCDGFVNDDWRAGGPCLCTIPALTHTIRRGHPLYDRLVTDGILLYQEIQPILDRKCEHKVHGFLETSVHVRAGRGTNSHTLYRGH